MANINAENYVSGIFSRAVTEVSKSLTSKINTRGTFLYDIQEEYSYLFNKLSRCPEYIVPKFVSKIEQLIKTIKEITELANSDEKKNLFESGFFFEPTNSTYVWSAGSFRRKR